MSDFHGYMKYAQCMFRAFRDQNWSWDTIEFGLVVVVSHCVCWEPSLAPLKM